MILTKVVDVKIINHNMNHYNDLGYSVKYGDLIKNVPVEHLSLGSHIMVDINCDKCGFVIKNIKYQDYIKVIKKSGEYLCNLCANKRTLDIKGISCFGESNDSNEKRKKTNLKKYGCEYHIQNLEVRNKGKKTNLEKIGFEFPIQNRDIFEKTMISSLKYHKYMDTELYYQGTYELDFLNHYFNEIKISKINRIKYLFENKNNVYYPDFYVKDLNLIIEIKSSYYYDKYLNKNLAKQKSCLEQGYNFIFIINKNYNEFDKILKNKII